MAPKNPPVPLGLPISGLILLIIGYVIGPIIQANSSEQQLARNVLLSAIPFILMFLGILIFFISFIWFIASKLNRNISAKVYRPVETILIGGIVFGVLGMFQPWTFALFKPGFLLLFASLLGFMVWSHIKPKSS
ncbi:MAG: hypothetical protein IPL78_17420 [Chloroflexi bacterium]|nr:hypothetical protein [Chloroflexota bacterium]